jgi:stage V sporulation protein R
MTDDLSTYATKLEALARQAGLDYYPVDFELVPDSFMMEVAVYGLPVRMPHWSFGVRYIYQLIQHRMGHSRLFEVVFPGNPGRAYLAHNNSLEENTLVTAHVLGHADFAKNNLLFKRSQEQVGYHIVEQAASHARQIAGAIEEHGAHRVEVVLDAALALEQHIDVHKALRRPRYPHYLPDGKKPPADEFHTRYETLKPDEAGDESHHTEKRRAPVPPYPEHDLLWFIAHYAPELEDWERDIFLAVREESFYFYPVFACQIMNEGWASYWHARLLSEADFLPQPVYLDAIKTHSDVVRPYAGEQQIALSVNPYHLGFSIWGKIVEAQGLDAARKIMAEDDDFSFVRNYLSEDLAKELGLFGFAAKKNGEVKVVETDINGLRESLLETKFNFGAPSVAAVAVQTDGTLELRHETAIDGRGLDAQRATKVLEYIQRVWRRPVILHTLDDRGDAKVLTVGAS